MSKREIVKVVATGKGHVSDGSGYAYVNHAKGHKASKIRTTRSLAEKLVGKGLGKIIEDDDDDGVPGVTDRATEKAPDAATRRLAEGAKASAAGTKGKAAGKPGAKGKAGGAAAKKATATAKLETAATGADTRDTTASQRPPLETNATDDVAKLEGKGDAEDAPPTE
jgi:hypothetical protein